MIEKVGRWIRIDRPTLTSLVLLGTLKNSGIAGGLALTLFSRKTALPATVSSVFMIVYIIWLDFKKRANRWSARLAVDRGTASPGTAARPVTPRACQTGPPLPAPPPAARIMIPCATARVEYYQKISCSFPPRADRISQGSAYENFGRIYPAVTGRHSFEKQAQAFDNGDDLMAFVRREGYDFTLEQLMDEFEPGGEVAGRNRWHGAGAGGPKRLHPAEAGQRGVPQAA